MSIFDFVKLFDQMGKRESQVNPVDSSANEASDTFPENKREIVETKKNPFDEAASLNSSDYVIEYEDESPAIIYVPYKRVTIRCKSTILDRMSVVSKFILLQLKKETPIDDISNAIGLDDACKNEIKLLQDNGLLENDNRLTELGTYYAGLIESINPFESGVNAYLNLYTNEVEILDGDFIENELDVKNKLPDNVLNNNYGIHLLKNDNYSNSRDVILSIMALNSDISNELIDSVYTTLKLESFTPVYIPMMIDYDESLKVFKTPIEVFVGAKEYDVFYESERVDGYRACINEMLLLEQHDKKLLSSEAMDIIDLYRKERSFEHKNFVRTPVDTKEYNKLLTIDELSDKAIVCDCHRKEILKSRKIDGLRRKHYVKSGYVKLLIDYSQLVRIGGGDV